MRISPLNLRWHKLATAIILLVTIVTYAPSVRAQSPADPRVPAGFSAIRLNGTFDVPTGFCFVPDGQILVAEKAGRVRLHDGTRIVRESVLDFSDEVNADWDRGLLGIAVHPNYQPDGSPQSWLYVSYNVSTVPGQDPFYQNKPGNYAPSRLTRYRTRALPNGTIAAMRETRQVLLGNIDADGVSRDGIGHVTDQHNCGALVFGEDGTLFVGAGDGSSGWINAGDFGGFDSNAFAKKGGPFPDYEDSGAFRAQDIRSLAGKVLRIDPETGRGLSDNPFFDGRADSNPSRVWTLGFRNPFRFCVRPGTGSTTSPGTLFIGDVGWNTWEELNVSRGGENFGWPCHEGNYPQPKLSPFRRGPDPLARPDCGTPTTGVLSGPSFASHHYDRTLAEPVGAYRDDAEQPDGFIGKAAVGGWFYTRGNYPEEYRGRLFYADYGFNFLRTMTFDTDNRLLRVHDFATRLGGAVDVKTHPITGDIHYLSIMSGCIFRIAYDNQVPVVAVAAVPETGRDVPLRVRLDATATTDPQGQPLTYRWEFSDGTPSITTNSAIIEHAFAQRGPTEVRVTATDPDNNSASAFATVTAGSTPPRARITSPADIYFYEEPEPLTLSAEASDDEDTTGVELLWRIDLGHDTHVHIGTFTTTGTTVPYTANTGGHGLPNEVLWFNANLTATDSSGLTTEAQVTLRDSKNSPDQCAKILDLPLHTKAPTTVRGRITHYAKPGPDNACLPGVPAAFFAITVPTAGTRLTATWDAQSPRSFVALYTGECGALKRLACRNTTRGTTRTDASFVTTTANQRIVVQVGALDAKPGQTLTVEAVAPK